MNSQFFLKRGCCTTALITLAVFYSTSGRAQAPNPTLQETLAWIENTFESNRGIIPAKISHSPELPCQVTVNEVDMWVSTVSLSDLDPDLTRIFESRSGSEHEWTIELQATNSRAVIMTGSKSSSKLMFGLYDEELAKRSATALTHAIELCGGKKSTF
jgi:hypothetical protein